MATVPAIRVWTSGEIVLASYLTNNVNAVLSFLLAPPIFKGRQTVAQSISNNTFTAVTYDSEDVDSVGGHSTSSNTSRYVAVYAGWYDKGGGATFAANATGRRLARPQINSTAVNGSMSGTPGNASIVSWAFRPDLVFLNVSDILEDSIYQDSGGSLNTFITNLEYQPTMTLAWRSN